MKTMTLAAVRSKAVIVLMFIQNCLLCPHCLWVILGSQSGKSGTIRESNQALGVRKTRYA